jgi:rSAM/selenodomain-associated transferase 2
MNARVSIVIPVVDEAAGIAATLNSLAACRAAGAQVLVVDGGSSDGTPERCEGLADRVLRSPRGRARQMNAGAALAQAPLLLFLHADTVLPEGAIECVERSLAAGGAAWGRFDVRIAGRSMMVPLIAALMNRRSRWSGIATGDQAIFVRRDAFVAAGGFPDQALMEDIELSRRLRKRFGWPACVRSPVITSGRRWERRGVWRTIWLMWRLRLLYWLGTPPDKLAQSYR